MTTKKMLVALVALCLTSAAALGSGGDRWTAEQIEAIGSLSLTSLGAPPADATNRVADDADAAALGRGFFFDARFSSNGLVACATCHDPALGFQDGRPLARGVGETSRRAMPLAGVAHSPFLFWDGRKDSQWAQALGPLESAVEHGGNRAQYARVIAEHYAADYERMFGALPDLAGVPREAGPVEDGNAREAWARLNEPQRNAVTRVFVNIGKAIAAYERTIEPRPSRFDRYADALRATGRAPSNVLSHEETAGLRLFVGKANCTRCHNGPLLTNNDFHNTGVPARAGSPPDLGRLAGAAAVLRDEFNCRSRWSDAGTAQCAELEFLVADGDSLAGAFKVPSLRNVTARAPYMHAGQMRTLAEVLDHYNRAPAATTGTSELEPLGLSVAELRELTAFLGALTSDPVD
jgi:cytochrome c peroxidase